LPHESSKIPILNAYREIDENRFNAYSISLPHVYRNKTGSAGIYECPAHNIVPILIIQYILEWKAYPLSPLKSFIFQLVVIIY
jgi:hypothetical protein